ncbi:MAG TPA: alpha/beta hydrolase [bacterium]|nr:alpha/beta hydrolase [bacterium]
MTGVNAALEAHKAGGEFVSVDGLNIFYRRAGSGSGTPLVLTHGIPRSSFLYRKMVPILGAARPVRAWDLYGFGLSEKPRDQSRYYFPKFEEFLGRFLDQLGIERAHLVCHDVGGPFTIGWAVRNPHRVASLTIMNTTVFLSGFWIPGPVLASILLPYSLQERFMSDAQFADMILRYIQRKALKNGDALAGEEGEAFKELLTRDGGRWSLARTLKAYRVVLPYLLGIQKALPRFTRPTLVLWGKHDPFCTLPIAGRFARAIPEADIRVVSHASHFLQEDQPEETSRIILDFIKRAEE